MHDEGGCALAECDCHEAVAVAGAVALVGALDPRDDDDAPAVAAVELGRHGWRCVFKYGPGTATGAALSIWSPFGAVAHWSLPRGPADVESIAEAMTDLAAALRGGAADRKGARP